MNYKGLLYSHCIHFSDEVHIITQFQDKDMYYSYPIGENPYIWPVDPSIGGYWTSKAISMFIKEKTWIVVKPIDYKPINNLIQEYEKLIE